MLADLPNLPRSGHQKAWQGGFESGWGFTEERQSVEKGDWALLTWHFPRLSQDFNRHLDTLTEHYDIPKVSWTK